MSNENEMNDVVHARKMIRWMNLGFLPSVENATRAQNALKLQYASPDCEVNLRDAIRVTGLMVTGAIASKEYCERAEVDISQLIDSMRDQDSNSLRANFRQRH